MKRIKYCIVVLIAAGVVTACKKNEEPPATGPAVSTFAGSGIMGGTDSTTALLSTFNHPQGLAIDAAGNLYVADFGGQTIRRVATDGSITTIAGAPAYVSKAQTHTVNLPQYGMEWSYTDRNAIQSDYRFTYRP